MLRILVALLSSLWPAMTAAALIVKTNDPNIYFHGRWDASPGTWWAGSGFKLHVRNAKSMALHLGNYTTAPFAAIGVSVDYARFFTVNVSTGINEIPLSIPNARPGKRSVIRINVEGWQNNRIHLRDIVFNSDAVLLPFAPSKLRFQFIGDSLSAGQFLPQGVNQAWPFLVGERFKAEHTVTAQPGATLTDMLSYGNVHGVSYQFFKTEDTGYYYTADHNYTTSWDFARDRPAPTHIVIHIGANDASQGVTDDGFVDVYSKFLTRLRTIYRTQPIFIFTPWGWPNADGNTSYYYQGLYADVIDHRRTFGDRNIFLVDTTDWVTFTDVFPDNVHPDVPGHAKIAGNFEAWLRKWGLEPLDKWENPV